MEQPNIEGVLLLKIALILRPLKIIKIKHEICQFYWLPFNFCAWVVRCSFLMRWIGMRYGGECWLVASGIICFGFIEFCSDRIIDPLPIPDTEIYTWPGLSVVVKILFIQIAEKQLLIYTDVVYLVTNIPSPWVALGGDISQIRYLGDVSL